MWWMLPVALVTSGCVVRYGQGKKPDAAAEARQPPVDFSEVEAQLAELVETTDDVDQRDRVDAAHALALQMVDQPPSAQKRVLAYLESFVAVEKRNIPVAVPLDLGAAAAVAGGAPVVVEQELAGPELEPTGGSQRVVLTRPDEIDASSGAFVGRRGMAAIRPEDPTAGEREDVDIILREAYFVVAMGDPNGAMAALEVCRDRPCWDLVAGLWGVARDNYIFNAKEDAAVRFLALRGEGDVRLQRTGLTGIQVELSELRARYPNNAYNADLAKHIERVQRELESLPEE